MVMEGLQEDMGDGNTQCADHPYKNTTPGGGICAFCLQEKLGKLVSSSFPIVVFPSSSSSPSPSFRSDTYNVAGNNTDSRNVAGNNSDDCRHYHSRRSRIPFLPTQKKKKKKDLAMAACPENQTGVVFKRSKSTANPRSSRGYGDDYSPQKRGFWSLLYLSKHSTTRKIDRASLKGICYASPATGSTLRQEEEEEIQSPDPASFDRKVSRSRSVGCGSRSFSGDFFERISTGFGDCALRRVESQREGKAKLAAVHRSGVGGGQDCIKERVKCGGLFRGFAITSSSSSTTSSSSTEYTMNGKGPSVTVPAAAAPSPARHLSHGRSKSWGWALASPIRAFSKPSSGKRDITASNKNTTPNLSAIPSLLAVGG